jgi:hypothetical protein
MKRTTSWTITLSSDNTYLEWEKKVRTIEKILDQIKTYDDEKISLSILDGE